MGAKRERNATSSAKVVGGMDGDLSGEAISVFAAGGALEAAAGDGARAGSGVWQPTRLARGTPTNTARRAAATYAHPLRSKVMSIAAEDITAAWREQVAEEDPPATGRPSLARRSSSPSRQ
jgi:hypothetical protein